MLIFDPRTLFFLLLVTSLLLVPFLFLLLPPLPFEPAAILPLVLAAEFVLHLLFYSLGERASTLTRGSLVAVGLTLGRAGICLLGAAIYSLIVAGSFLDAVWLFWIKNPPSIFFQIALLGLATPYLIATFAPSLLGEETYLAMERFSNLWTSSTRATLPIEAGAARPLGGYVRVFSYEELSEYFRKAIGCEGFCLYSREGLIVWEDLQVRLPIEEIVVAAEQQLQDVQAFSRRYRLQEVSEVFIETREHLLFNIPVSDEIRLLLFFTPQVRLREVAAKVELLTRTTREFLASRYAGEESRLASPNLSSTEG